MADVVYTPPQKAKTWETTREANLLRNVASGRYYARFVVRKKQKWVNLDTDDFTVAKRRLATERANVEQTRLASETTEAGVATFGHLAAILREQIATDATIGDSTRRLKDGVVRTLFKTWPELEFLKPERLTADAVVRWRDRLAKHGTGFVPPGAKARAKLCDGSSASRINKFIDALRAMLNIAIDRGQIATNFLNEKRRGVKLPTKPKKPDLPESQVLEAIFADIEKRRPDSGELVRFLAYTGCRLGEANAATWGDVSFDRGLLHVRGTKTDAADREIPLIPPARALLEKLKARREERAAQYGLAVRTGKSDPILETADAGNALKTSCKNLGVNRLTHHDLRDAFITACLEAGVDVPTIAAWVGHKDGGALLMRVYAHHRRAHSLAQAARVNFTASIS